MHFIRLKPLKEKLRTGTLGQAEAASYLVAAFLIYELVDFPSDCTETTIVSWKDWAVWIMSMLILCGGTCYSYRKNGGSKGIDFLSRFLSLYWVIGWRVILSTTVTAGSLIWLIKYFAHDFFENPYVYDVPIILALAILAFIYWRIGEHLHDIARFKKEYNPSEHLSRPVE